MEIVGHILILCISQTRRCTPSSSNKTCKSVRGGVQPPSQADTRSMSQWESCVTEVKIEAQAISGVCLALKFLVFPLAFPHSAFPSVTCLSVTQRRLFQAGAIVYDGLTEQFCIHPLSLLPSCPSLPAPPLTIILGISELCVPLLCDMTDLL